MKASSPVVLPLTEHLSQKPYKALSTNLFILRFHSFLHIAFAFAQVAIGFAARAAVVRCDIVTRCAHSGCSSSHRQVTHTLRGAMLTSRRLCGV